MPPSAAASTSDRPLGTVSSRPLMVRVTVSVSTVATTPRPLPRRPSLPTAARPGRSPPAPRPQRSPPAPPVRGPRPRPGAGGRAGTLRGTRSCHRLRRVLVVVQPRDRAGAHERAAALVDVALELLAEAGDVARHRHRHGIAERAQALAEDAVAHVQQQVELPL